MEVRIGTSTVKNRARGYAVSTVGFGLENVKKHIAQQEKLEKDQEDGKF